MWTIRDIRDRTRVSQVAGELKQNDCVIAGKNEVRNNKQRNRAEGTDSSDDPKQRG